MWAHLYNRHLPSYPLSLSSFVRAHLLGSFNHFLKIMFCSFLLKLFFALISENNFVLLFVNQSIRSYTPSREKQIDKFLPKLFIASTDRSFSLEQSLQWSLCTANNREIRIKLRNKKRAFKITLSKQRNCILENIRQEIYAKIRVRVTSPLCQISKSHEYQLSVTGLPVHSVKYQNLMLLKNSKVKNIK